MSELKHYGVIGMKWGIRRYQPYSVKPRASGKTGRELGKAREYARTLRKNKSGSSTMTNEELAAEVKRLNLEKQYEKLTKDTSKRDNLNSASNALREANNITNRTRNIVNRQPQRKQHDVSNMSDKELRDEINRLNLERQYDQLLTEKENLDNGKTKVVEILDTAGDALAIATSAALLLVAINQLKG